MTDNKKKKQKPRGNSNKLNQIVNKAKELKKQDKYKNMKWCMIIKEASKQI